MMDITTKSSTKVKDASFRFGKFFRKDKFIPMTTPTLPPFHQKIFPHANSDAPAKGISLAKNNPSLLYPEGVGVGRPLREPSAFTLVELLAVITIIGVLAGLTLGAAGAVRRHGATNQAKAEIAALQAACERYFADNNLYPSTNSMPDPSSSSDVNPSSTSYTTAGRSLFSSLHGANQYNRPPSPKRYFEAKPAMVSSTTASDPYYVDPWGYAYGYNSDGTNAPQIWSTAGQTSGGGNTNKWIVSWARL